MHNVGEKTFVKKSLEWTFIAVSMIVFAAVLMMSSVNLFAGTADSIKLLSDGWYTMENDERTAVSLPLERKSGSGEALILYNDSLTKSDAGRMITTRGAQYGLSVFLDGEQIYKYEDKAFPRNSQMKSKQDCDARIPVDFDGGKLKMVLDTPLRGEYRVPHVWIGTGSDVLFHHFQDAAATFAVAFIFIILAVIAVGTAGYLHSKSIESRRFVDAALFLLVCSVWFMTDTSVMQRYGGNAANVCIISFYAFMLLSVPMLHLVKNTGGMQKYRTIDALIFAFYLNAIGQGVLNLCLGIDFVDMLVVTHVLLFIGVSAITILMTRESRCSADRDVRMVLTAFVTVGMSGVLALLLYWILEIPYYGNIFQAGILIFVIMILFNIIMSMAENIHYRTEMMAYQRMLKEDWMTGLGNRQPFEEHLSELQKSKDLQGNPALIFLDLNQLKRINDEFGHAAGDEVIIGAAKCMSKVFGDDGKCYRIGGDEFGVILPEPKITAEEWFEKLEQEILQYNRGSRYRLSIAYGWSDLKEEDGHRKTLSDWKYEADCRMYENKGGLRRL